MLVIGEKLWNTRSNQKMTPAVLTFPSPTMLALDSPMVNSRTSIHTEDMGMDTAWRDYKINNMEPLGQLWGDATLTVGCQLG